ncbi:hypothetical protein CEY00_Acc26722 [Actinidia chinensis var. chinensis]|uniref:Uncharacterized protein n=1 Tax=Actinidia chinensis var. chinensis TaxID=1590841 RepID=A0A2R6PV98_ACTCC|nr:hypothetical protein CEY00_Acc26722 [Actinidia chinensis var. chinensis]
MEEEKAAAYHDELTRKSEAASRFKQGSGFSSTVTPARGSALPSSSRSSFLSSFVRASSPSKTGESEKNSQLESIQNKLKKSPNTSEVEQSSRVSRRRSWSLEGRISRHRDRRRSRSLSPWDQRREKSGVGTVGKEKNVAIDYAKLIDGFDKMLKRMQRKVRRQDGNSLSLTKMPRLMTRT